MHSSGEHAREASLQVAEVGCNGWSRPCLAIVRRSELFGSLRLFFRTALKELQRILHVDWERVKSGVVTFLRRVARFEWLVVLHERRSLFTSLSSRVVSVLSDDFLCRVEKLSLLGLLRERLLLHE